MTIIGSIRVFVRRLRRVLSFAFILLGHTLHLVMTAPMKDATTRERYRACRQSLACRRAVESIGIDVHVVGNVPVDSGYLIVSNHLGFVDPFVIASHFLLVFSGKAEMMHWPVVGWVLRSIGLIPVYRGRRSRALSFAEEVARRLVAGLNVLAFPEGTTSGGTDILPFKTGAFAALESVEDGRVLPLTLRVVEIDGAEPDSMAHSRFTWTDSNQSLFAHAWSLLGIRSSTVEIVIGAPIASAGLSRKQLAETAHNVIRRSSQSQNLGVAVATKM